ncbi:MAG TPA: hypothetical protein VGH79_11345 [Gaiellaceae bacterium]
MRRPLALAALVSIAVLAGSAHATPLPNAPKCEIFPADNPWNTPVASLPVAKDSAAMIKAIGLNASLHPDFGSGKWNGGPIGIPYDVVSKTTPTYRVRFQYASESDDVRYPIPKHVHIEGGAKSTGDRHALLVDKSTCRLYELYDLQHTTRGWKAGSGATWSLSSDKLRPAGWTSADAAGLPILPGLVRWDEVAQGTIDHALRFTAPKTRRAYVYPARHFASSSTSISLPPMGLRVRLKPGIDLSKFPNQARVVLVALQVYGMILADNGSPWYVSGAPSAHWSNDALHALSELKGSDFEVVDTSSLPEPGK